MLESSKRKAVLITGVSSGIGYDAARYLIRQGMFVFGSVRKAKEAERLQREFDQNFKALIFDVADKASILNASNVVKDVLGGQTLGALINNAGVAVAGPVQLLDDDKFRYQMEVCMFGVRNVTNVFLPLLGAAPGSGTSASGSPQDKGKIINISSISGIFNTPMNGAYCVAKHALESLGEIYRRELIQYGIDVVSIRPGPIQSDIWEKNLGTMNAYMATDYATMIERTEKIMISAQKHALPAQTVSRLIHRVIEAKRPKCSYIVDRNKWRVIMLTRLLPKRMVDRLIWKALN